MRKQHSALIPTLTLWTTVVQDPKVREQLVGAGMSELKSYFAEGGTILFGTDVGFTSKYDTTQEYEFMGRAMGWKDILASLTTNPAGYFKAPTKGCVEKGMDADFRGARCRSGGGCEEFREVSRLSIASRYPWPIRLATISVMSSNWSPALKCSTSCTTACAMAHAPMAL